MSIKFQREFQMTIYPIQYKQDGSQSFGQPTSFTAPVGQTITIKNPKTGQKRTVGLSEARKLGVPNVLVGD